MFGGWRDPIQKIRLIMERANRNPSPVRCVKIDMRYTRRIGYHRSEFEAAGHPFLIHRKT
jgi:hypothetical protein